MNTKYTSIVALLASFIYLPPHTQAGTTITTSNRYAYGANIGWIDARGDVTNGLAAGQLFCTGYVWSANCGWIHFGKGPTNGFAYSNTSSNDYGVNVSGSDLRGYAYGANIGWINFEGLGDPSIDLLTGRMTGYAWGANVGWIGLSNNFAYVQTICLEPGPDSDLDGIPDVWELNNAGDLGTYGPYPADSDLDGVPDVDEYIADTDPDLDDHYLHMTFIGKPAPTSTVTWTISQSRIYALEQSIDVSNNTVWVDSGLGVMAPDPSKVMTRNVTDPSATNRYYRTRAIVPLQKP